MTLKISLLLSAIFLLMILFFPVSTQADTGGVTGHVTEVVTSDPIVDVTVKLNQGFSNPEGTTAASTTTDASGEYTLTNIAPGAYTLVLSKTNYYTKSENISIVSGFTATRDFQLVSKIGSITGTVTESGTGSPIAGATLALNDNFDNYGAWIVFNPAPTTDANGEYTIANIPTDAGYTVSVTKETYSDPPYRNISLVSPYASTPTIDFAMEKRPLEELVVITKEDSPDPVEIGKSLTYKITVTNNDIVSHSDVSVTDSLPGNGVEFISANSTQGTCTYSNGAVNCNLGTLAKKESVTITIIVEPLSMDLVGEEIENTANLGYGLEASTKTLVVASYSDLESDLVLFKEDNPDPVKVGQLLTYKLTVINHKGPDLHPNVRVTDHLPDGVVFVSANSTQGTCTYSNNEVNCNLGTLTEDSEVTVTIVVRPTIEGEIKNEAIVDGDGTDPRPLNNSASTWTRVEWQQQEVYLSLGWNLMSIRVQPVDTSIGSVLLSIAGKYDSVWRYFSNPGWRWYLPNAPQVSNLTDVEPGIGYWILTTEACSLTIQGNEPSAAIPLITGWNLVGYNLNEPKPIVNCMYSIEGKYDSVWEYDPILGWRWYFPNAPQASNLVSMRSGFSYWIDVIIDCSWNVSEDGPP